MTALQTSATELADLVRKNISRMPEDMWCSALRLCTDVYCDIYVEAKGAGSTGAPLPPPPPPGQSGRWLPRIIDGGLCVRG